MLYVCLLQDEDLLRESDATTDPFAKAESCGASSFQSFCISFRFLLLLVHSLFDSEQFLSCMCMDVCELVEEEETEFSVKQVTRCRPSAHTHSLSLVQTLPFSPFAPSLRPLLIPSAISCRFLRRRLGKRVSTV